MELFAHNDEVVRLEAGLPSQKGATRLQTLLLLAWYVRQSDPERSQVMASEIETLLESFAPSTSERARFDARLTLMSAERKWLGTDLSGAIVLAESALRDFTLAHDFHGRADAHWLIGLIATDLGDNARRNTEHQFAASVARMADDQVRLDMAEASIACSDAMRDARMAWEKWGTRFWPDMPGLNMAAAVWVYDFLAIIAVMKSDFGTAAAYWMHTWEGAMSTGQVRRAISSATNIGDAFNSLNEHHGALDWMQRGLDLARQFGWGGSLGICLAQTGETLRRLGRLDAAQDLLSEALSALKPLAGSRNYATTLAYIGELRLDRRQSQDALDIFREFQLRAEELNQSDFQTLAQRGQAHALLQLGQGEAGLAAAQKAYALAGKNRDSFRQIDALRVLADIHAQYRLPDPPLMQEPSASLHYLNLALEITNSIVGYQVNGDLFDAFASEYARLQQFERAYEYAQLAKRARAETQTQEANHRAIALQVQQQTERVRADIAHHRQLATAEAERAEALHQQTITLERLSAIGQEITAQLDCNVVFHALNRHVHSLLDANSFMIFLLDPDGTTLSRAFGYEEGHPIPNRTLDLSNPTADSIKCVRERREVLRDFAPDDATPNLIPGTLHTRTALFAPLAIGDRVLGVLSAQSVRRHAFGERERLVFRTLCAYGAIALDNANAYQQLQEAHQHMVGQEKLAALGALVAGVAHELNTPIGNCLMITSAFQDRTSIMRQRLQSPSLQRSELVEFIDDAEEASAVVMRGLTSAADLVSSFKQVAVDRTTAQRRVFDLAQTTHEIIATMMNQIKIAGHSISQEVASGISLNSYPGPYGQVITNLIHNALLHGFDGKTGGHMALSAKQPVPGRVQIIFRDDGCGISEQNQRRIFEPFFTTKMGQGGSGLGLSISYNIITSLLGGQIQCDSQIGQGTTFVLDIPLQAQEQAWSG